MPDVFFAEFMTADGVCQLRVHFEDHFYGHLFHNSLIRLTMYEVFLTVEFLSNYELVL